jgi:hypothetical protein
MVPMRIRQNDHHESDPMWIHNTGHWHEMVSISLTIPTYLRCKIKDFETYGFF